MLTTNEELPEDLVIQILLWLPVISLLRFKCVCKSWCVLISSQNFITRHLPHNQTISNKNKNGSLLLLQNTSHNYVFAKLPYETIEISSTQVLPSLYFGFDTNVGVEIIGSSNGLVCLHVEWGNIILWNPATKKTKVVPKSRISYPQSKSCLLDLGFGFDIKTNDYKVVMILNADDYSNPELTFLERKNFNIAEVYCLSTNSWKKVHAWVPDKFVSYNRHRTYTKGMFSWYGYYRDDWLPCILSFDMSNELFLRTTIPDDSAVGYCNDNWRSFFVLNELVSLVILIEDMERSESCIHIWSLLEFGVRDSWTKLFTIGPLMRIDRSFGFLQNNSMLLKNNEGQLLLYNLFTEEMTDLRFGGVSSKWLQVIPYMESLISVKGENDLEDQDSS
ncbi:F-box/kelch-repeat protein At3g06240-like [Castanea sativa]|uniref:F-box/kelch-repeat protein At3g06240-like n=1 Tax=Castanea sativa TaxID=21020 RepID=UPI003F64DFF6